MKRNLMIETDLRVDRSQYLNRPLNIEYYSFIYTGDSRAQPGRYLNFRRAEFSSTYLGSIGMQFSTNYQHN